MKLGKAIEILSLKVKYEYSAHRTDEGDAVKLSIQALNLVQRSRQNWPTPFELRLPGETPEPASP